MVRLRPVWMTDHPPSVLWHCWLGHQTCKNRRPYNLYCVGADVKPCSINQSDCSSVGLCMYDECLYSVGLFSICTCLSVCMCVYMCMCQSFYSACTSVWLSVCRSISVCMSICRSLWSINRMYVCMYCIYVYACLPACLDVCVSVCLYL